MLRTIAHNVIDAWYTLKQRMLSDQPSLKQLRSAYERTKTLTPRASYITANADLRTPQPNDLLVFFHGQRTGGSAFRHFLAEAYGEDQIYATQWVKDAFEHWRVIDVDKTLADYKVFAGHSNFKEKPSDRRYLFISLLRNPVFRCASLHRYCQRKEGHRLRELANEVGMDEFYRKGKLLMPRYFKNTQCERIAGKNHIDADAAIELIETRYLAVGATENLTGFVQDLGAVLGWPSIDVPRKGSDYEQYKDMISDDFINMALEDNREDFKLWTYMAEKYFNLPADPMVDPVDAPTATGSDAAASPST